MLFEYAHSNNWSAAFHGYRMTDQFQSMDNRLISFDDRFITMDQRMQLLEADMAQIKINVSNTLQHIVLEDQRDQVPWHFSFFFVIVDKLFLDYW